jgi:hypothetical protein
MGQFLSKKLCEDREGHSSSGKEEEGDEHNLVPAMS